MTKGILQYLMSNGVPAIVVAIFAASVLILITNRNTLLRSRKIILITLIVICLLFLAVLICMSVVSGR